MQKSIPEEQREDRFHAALSAVWRAGDEREHEEPPIVDATAHILTEGVAPTADTLVLDDIEVGSLSQYGCLYQVSDQATDPRGRRSQ